MSLSNVCRLCFSAINGEHVDLFSDIGIQLKISDIISEHFKCNVNETDYLPKVVCSECWSTTDAFHKLFQKSQSATAIFLHSIIKIEKDVNDTTSFDHIYIAPDFSEDQPNDVSEIKIETSPATEDIVPIDSISGNDEYIEHIEDKRQTTKVVTYKTTNKSNHDENSKVRRKSAQEKKLLKNQFEQLLAENKHRFDMSCDKCSFIFESYDEARSHYATAHNNKMGYIKCCKKKLIFPYQIENHLQFHHLDLDKFKCKECGKNFCSLYTLQTHMKLHTNIYICDNCTKSFTSKNCLRAHLKKHAADKLPDSYDKFIADNFDMSCDQCDTVFNSFYDARCHYKESHNENNGYIKCCKIKLRKLCFVMNHIESHLNPAHFECDCCNKTFPSTKAYNEHLLRQSRTFICDMCGKRFLSKFGILNHFVVFHSDLKPKFECKICQKRFKLQSLLRTHMQCVHRNKKPSITCEICGRSFYAKFHLEKHLRTHSDKSERLAERKQCDHCGEWLMTRSGIYYHKQIHLSGVQKCEHCGIELPNKNALQGHIRKHHRERKYKCGYCDRAYSTRADMKSHEEYHTRHNDYPCQYCGKMFTVPSSRLTHVRRNHFQQYMMSKDKTNKFAHMT